MRGAINEGWGYDVSAQYSSGSANTTTLNYFVTPRVARALDVVDVGGVPTCQSAIDGTDTNCVPWNPFQFRAASPRTSSTISRLPASRSVASTRRSTTPRSTVTSACTASSRRSPRTASSWCSAPSGAATRCATTVDSLQEAGQLAGSGGPTIGISGGTKVEELFMEARVPIAQDRAGMESLSFDTAYRYSDYGDGVQTDTYKFGLEWAPIQDVRLRGSYQKAVRAANIVELFTAQGFNLFDMTGDPCGAVRGSGSERRGVHRVGRPGGNVGATSLDSPAGQYNFLQGGNTALTPEEADTYSYGVVFTPRFAPGLALTVDYFDIKIDNTISTFGPRTRWTRAMSTTIRRPATASTATRTASCGSAPAMWWTPTSTSVRCRPRAGTST